MAVTLEILDVSGTVLRSLEAPNEAGVQEVVWDFRVEPAFETSGGGGGGFRGGPAPGEGPRVLPGTYTVRLTVGDEVREREVEVRLDPRREASRGDLAARQDALMLMHRLAAPLREAGQRLARMDRRLEEIEALVSEAELDASVRAEISEAIEGLSEAVETARSDLGRANRLGRSTSGIESWSGRPTADQEWAIAVTWREVPAVIEGVNELLTERMPALERRLGEAGVRPRLGEPITVPRRP